MHDVGRVNGATCLHDAAVVSCADSVTQRKSSRILRYELRTEDSTHGMVIARAGTTYKAHDDPLLAKGWRHEDWSARSYSYG